MKKQEDYKLVQMLWTLKKEMAHQKFSMEWVPSCESSQIFYLAIER